MVPEKKMEVEKFLAWTEAKHVENGKLLATVDFTKGEIGNQFRTGIIGHYTFEFDDNKKLFIQHVETGDSIKVPASMASCTNDDIGKLFEISKNWSQEAKLTHLEDGWCLELKKKGDPPQAP